ncbi:ABC transporter substrate-binding protein [Gordonia jinghuaiqii]|uniref:ABC transporter substrate-binding protein n=1 Tax=Gordonia jinghuaiqii TaxID=2758710 RepID=A0A7D7LXW1_9ACTN|nr:ABC transporter substrate-binding protein [Gordonia jinghuaiqii]MCR5978724.1 ABC transporter substrate-binding protein [Gordonia jinghuaiqii]QMT03035.1 ABC transporter substrate-binding protein [Gordonia jinghuaiqii]
MHFSRFTRRTRFACATAVLALIAGCSSSLDEPSAGAAVVLDNCGHTTTVAAPPERVVSLNQGSTEILLSLGLAERMVGTATWTDPVRENLAQANARVPRLADNKPSLETVLATEPDFVTASFGGTLGAGGVADREQFDRLGVPTYLSPTDCIGKSGESVNSDGAREEPFTLELVYREIRELARIFDVAERGEQLVSELARRHREATMDAGPGTSMVFWFADTKTPYMAGCCGSSGVIAEAVGARNIFADTTDEWPQVSWESVAERNPTVIVLADLSRRSIDGDALSSKIEFLESHPVTSKLDAVRAGRYAVVNGADLNPSIRTVDGVEKVAAALRNWNTPS